MTIFGGTVVIKRRKITDTLLLEQREQHFMDIVELLSQESQNISAGIYNFSFAYNIPFRMPQTLSASEISTKKSQFKWDYKVHYHCEGKLSYWFQPDLICRPSFIVKRNDYSNHSPLLREPIERQISKEFYGFFHKNEPFHMRVVIPYAGIAAGEWIGVRVECNNQSRLKIKKTKIALLEITDCINQGQINGFAVVVNESEGVDKNATNEFTHNLHIPNFVRLSDIFYSQLLSVKHAIGVKAVVKGLHFNPSVIVPVVIGSLRYTDGELNEQSSLTDEDNLALVKHLTTNF